MSREIKFRGKSQLGMKPFITGFYLYDEYRDSFSLAWKPEDDNWQITPVYEETVGQFIGITDSMGKDIFTGDIVIDLKSRKYTVEFNDEFCAFFLHPIDDRESFMGIYPDIVLSIFGNIHENPELLNQPILTLKIEI